MTGYSRREFLAASAGVVVGAGWLGSSQVSTAAETVVSPGAAPAFQPIEIPAWVREVTRMSFLGPDAVQAVAKIGVQVVHGNAVWPYYPLRRDGGKPSTSFIPCRCVASAKLFKLSCSRGVNLPPSRRNG